VLGLFNAQSPGGAKLSGSVAPSDVPALPSGEFALYLKRRDTLRRVTRSEQTAVELSPLSAEIATIASLSRGVAALGLADKLNGGAAVLSADWQGDDYVVELCDGGHLLCFSERRPSAVTSDARALSFDWRLGRLDVTLPADGPQRIRLAFSAP
jgi:hypothetical protein